MSITRRRSTGKSDVEVHRGRTCRTGDAGLRIDVEFALAGPLDGPEAARAWERRAYIGSDAEASEEVLLDEARRYWLSDKLLLPTEANAHPTDGFEGGRRLPAVTTPRRPPGAEGCGRFPVAAIADDLPVGGNAVRGILKAVPHLLLDGYGTTHPVCVLKGLSSRSIPTSIERGNRRAVQTRGEERRVNEEREVESRAAPFHGRGVVWRRCTCAKQRLRLTTTSEGGTRERTVIVLSLAARASPAATPGERPGGAISRIRNDPVNPLFESERNRIQ